MIKSQARSSAAQEYTPPYYRWSIPERIELPSRYFIWEEGTIAMPEPLESELAGVTLESDALLQEDFPPGDLRRHPEAPGHSYLEEAAAAPTSGEPQVPNEDPLINFEFEAGGGEAPQPPAPSGFQTTPTATAGGAVGDHL
jgi:hypothetical protein